MSGIWRGVDKPAGARFYTPPNYAHLPDCPVCRFGTLFHLGGGRWRCMDCRAEVDRETEKQKRMKLNEAKQAAYGAAHRASAKTETMMNTATLEDARELVQMGRMLTGAALEIEARLKGVPEPKPGE